MSTREIAYELARRKMVATSPSVIEAWSRECLRDGLFLKDGVAKAAFEGKERVLAMVYLPGVGWSLWQTWGNRLMRGTFVHPDHRRRGIGSNLYQTALLLWPDSVIRGG